MAMKGAQIMSALVSNLFARNKQIAGADLLSRSKLENKILSPFFHTRCLLIPQPAPPS